jgi:hypothetical protein
MSEKKTRKPQVSVRGETYDKLKKHCDKSKTTVTAFVEELCAAFFGKDDDRTAKKKGNGKSKKETADHRTVKW